MSRTPIYFRRGNIADIPTLAVGEPGFATDTKKLFIGASGGNARVAMATQAAWIAPTLLNSWVNLSTFYPAGYRKNEFGQVELRGVIASGSAVVDTPLFQLPAGYRPSSRKAFVVSSSNGSQIIGRVDIFSDGTVIFEAGGNTYFSFDSIPPFDAEL